MPFKKGWSPPNKGKRYLKEKICPSCKKEFQPSRSSQVYCTNKCRMSLSENKKCLVCTKIIHSYPSRIKRGQNKYCSRKCFNAVPKIYKREKNHLWKGGPQKCICEFCKKEFYVYINKKSLGKFCSRICATTASIGKISKRRNGYYINCQICDKSFYIAKWMEKNKRKYCSRKCQFKAQINNPNRIFKNTSIELKVEKELKNRKINYQKQVGLCNIAIVDFYLPEHNIVIEADGCYWHGCPIHFPNNLKGKEKDKLKTETLIANGYQVYRFWECEINASPKMCIDRLNLLLEKKNPYEKYY